MANTKTKYFWYVCLSVEGFQNEDAAQRFLSITRHEVSPNSGLTVVRQAIGRHETSEEE